MTLLEELLNKARRHTDIYGTIGLITELHNQGVPTEEWSDIIKSQGFTLKDIPFSEGSNWSFDIQSGTPRNDLGFTIRKRF